MKQLGQTSHHRILLIHIYQSNLSDPEALNQVQSIVVVCTSSCGITGREGPLIRAPKKYKISSPILLLHKGIDSTTVAPSEVYTHKLNLTVSLIVESYKLDLNRPT